LPYGISAHHDTYADARTTPQDELATDLQLLRIKRT